MVDGSLKVEYAKSGRAACSLCGSAIAMGVMRIGRESTANGRTNVRWHHSKCFTENHPEVDFVKMSGFNLLKLTDQNSLKFVGSSTDSKTDNGASIVPGASKPVAEKSPTSTMSIDNLQTSNDYKGIPLPEGWKACSSLIIYEAEDLKPSESIAAFDFDGTLANTSVMRSGADQWSLLYPSIPAKLQFYKQQGYKLVIFTNESNIDRWTKQRAKAIDSKIGRLMSFMEAVKLPLQMYIACAKSTAIDAFRKPAVGMWEIMEKNYNGGVKIDKERSFYVGDAAGRKSDHSDADIEFAKILGLKFLLPEEVFLTDRPELVLKSHDSEDDKPKTHANSPSAL